MAQKQKKSTFGFLITSLADMDIKRDYEFLKGKLKLGEDRLDVDVLSEAIDDAPELAFKAAQISAYAKEQLAKFDDTIFKLRYAELSTEATEDLELQKKQGKISGQITREKIENWILLNKQEYNDLLKEHRELKAAVDVFGSLATQFESKKSLLQTQGRLLERKKIIVSGGKN